MALTRELFHSFRGYDNSKDLWKALQKRFEDNSDIKKSKRDLLRKQYECFRFLENESIDEPISRFYHLQTELKAFELKYPDEELVEKFLDALPPKFKMYTTLMRENPKFYEMTIDEAIGKVQAHDMNLKRKESSGRPQIQDPSMYHGTSSTTKSSGSGIALFSGNSHEEETVKACGGHACYAASGSSSGSGSHHQTPSINPSPTSSANQSAIAKIAEDHCKKQSTVSVPTCEAKYIAAASSCSQILWIQQQLRDYGLNFTGTPLFIDKNATMSITNNPVWLLAHTEPEWKGAALQYREIVEFLNRSRISYAISADPIVSRPYLEQFWETAEHDCTVTPNVIRATVAGKDAMGHDLATAMVGLSLNKGYNFSRYIFKAINDQINTVERFSQDLELELSAHSDEQQQQVEEVESVDESSESGDKEAGHDGAEGSESKKTESDSSDSDDAPSQTHPRRTTKVTLPESSSKRKRQSSSSEYDPDSDSDAAIQRQRRESINKNKGDRQQHAIPSEVEEKATGTA
ncbi:hypothetical protein L1987_13490 [Smallanthus sonchifolius]|uniref:Uncharacterized protein n=1 Tax=Smallanthus sonchifolius TaxID=185202 RepID=A0ACB9JJ08_9ASTR|nr:hypothetical protein L1987_13490 [Smallanthus sonchifolius]